VAVSRITGGGTSEGNYQTTCRKQIKELPVIGSRALARLTRLKCFSLDKGFKKVLCKDGPRASSIECTNINFFANIEVGTLCVEMSLSSFARPTGSSQCTSCLNST
jgi:hypothetical protein